MFLKRLCWIGIIIFLFSCSEFILKTKQNFLFLFSAALQFAFPDEYLRYNTDPSRAVLTRKVLLERMLKDQFMITEMTSFSWNRSYKPH